MRTHGSLKRDPVNKEKGFKWSTRIRVADEADEGLRRRDGEDEQRGQEERGERGGLSTLFIVFCQRTERTN